MFANYFEYFVHIAYLLTLLAFMVNRLVWLRMLVVVASVLTIVYSYTVPRMPLWIPIIWHSLFIVANLGHLFWARLRNRNIQLNALEDFLAQTALVNFPSAEVKRFAMQAEDRVVGPQQQIISEGQPVPQLFFMVHGTVNVIQAGQVIAQLTPGYFVGEMSLLTKSMAKATVVTAEECRVLSWPHEKIDEWVSGDMNRLSLLQTALGSQIVEVLMQRSVPEVGEHAV